MSEYCFFSTFLLLPFTDSFQSWEASDVIEKRKQKPKINQIVSFSVEVFSQFSSARIVLFLFLVREMRENCSRFCFILGYRINVPGRLSIFRKFSTQDVLIWYRTFINFPHFHLNSRKYISKHDNFWKIVKYIFSISAII